MKTVAGAKFSVLRRGAAAGGRSDVGAFGVIQSGLRGRIGPVRGDQLTDMGVKVESWRILKVSLRGCTSLVAGDRISYAGKEFDVRYVFEPTTGARPLTIAYVEVE